MRFFFREPSFGFPIKSHLSHQLSVMRSFGRLGPEEKLDNPSFRDNLAPACYLQLEKTAMIKKIKLFYYSFKKCI